MLHRDRADGRRRLVIGGLLTAGLVAGGLALAPLGFADVEPSSRAGEVVDVTPSESDETSALNLAAPTGEATGESVGEVDGATETSELVTSQAEIDEFLLELGPLPEVDESSETGSGEENESEGSESTEEESAEEDSTEDSTGTEDAESENAQESESVEEDTDVVEEDSEVVEEDADSEETASESESATAFRSGKAAGRAGIFSNINVARVGEPKLVSSDKVVAAVGCDGCPALIKEQRGMTVTVTASVGLEAKVIKAGLELSVGEVYNIDVTCGPTQPLKQGQRLVAFANYLKHDFKVFDGPTLINSDAKVIGEGSVFEPKGVDCRVV